MENITGKNANTLFRLAQIDSFLGVLLVLWLSFNNKGIFKPSFFKLGAIALFLFGIGILLFLQKRFLTKNHAENITKFLQSIHTQLAIIIFFVIFSLYLSITNQITLLNKLFPFLVVYWLFTLQILLLFTIDKKFPTKETGDMNSKKQVFAIFSTIGLYMYMAIPSRLPAIMNGLPWNTPAEFILVLAVIPFILISSWNIIGKKIYPALIWLAVLVKIGAAFYLPQSGIGIRSYQSAEKLATNQWEKSYTSLIYPEYSDMMTEPYAGTLEFPTGWMTLNSFQNTPKPWLGISLHGFARIPPREELIFQTQGLQRGKITLKDPLTKHEFDVVMIDRVEDKESIQFADTIPPGVFEVTGELIYKSEQPYQLSAILVNKDSSTRSAFEEPVFWTTNKIFTLSTQIISIFSGLTSISEVYVLGWILFLFLAGFASAVNSGKSSLLIIFTGISSALLIAMFAKLYENVGFFLPWKKLADALQYLCLFFIIINTVIIQIEKSDSNKKTNWFFTAIGLPAIVMFLFIYLHGMNIKEQVLFNTYNDPYEYQYFANKIFIQGDYFLLQTPPRAYKVLFPYLIGFIHLLFGQSAIPQFFLNGWYGLISAYLAGRIIQQNGVFPQGSDIFSSLFFALLFGTYFYTYFMYGLIEAVAILSLCAFFYFTQRKSTLRSTITGIFTIMLRMDYAGAVIAGLMLFHPAITGTFQQAWSQVLLFIKKSWFKLGAQTLLMIAPSILIITAYTLLNKNYMLNAEDTTYKNLAGMLEGFSRIIIGGNLEEIHILLDIMPVMTTITALLLVGGAIIGLITLILRIKLLRGFDMRWSLITIGFLCVYFFVKPTAYAPRFSAPMLLLASIILSLIFNLFIKHRYTNNQGE